MVKTEECYSSEPFLSLLSLCDLLRKLFHHKDRSILFPDLCSTRDGDFWERLLSLNSHVSLFYVLFYSLFYIHVVVVLVHQGNCWEEVE